MRRFSFDRAAAAYDDDPFTPDRATALGRLRHLLDCWPLAEDGAVLEIGAGTGIYTALIASQIARPLVAMDSSINMLRQGQKRFEKKGARRVCGSAEILPFNDDSFDTVVAIATLHHLEDPDRAFGEIARILKPGGRFLAIEPNSLNPVNLVLGLCRRGERGMLFSWPRRWNRLAQRNGFAVVGESKAAFFPKWPAPFRPAYDRLERLLQRVPLVRSCALFHYACWQNG